ncbi:hypothetical protein AAL_02271 [Moelleriella libera RCEF 2490]|uniref:Uncharacterized protein n=1 Tax=Moelleriella libera RCEF 2490 TaxID=1081109 RepID=A0A168FBV8_9HYPO|nr:hypothetical protein AAL_02271 [Moelleriella libera RCEF 2490]
MKLKTEDAYCVLQKFATSRFTEIPLSPYHDMIEIEDTEAGEFFQDEGGGLEDASGECQRVRPDLQRSSISGSGRRRNSEKLLPHTDEETPFPNMMAGLNLNVRHALVSRDGSNVTIRSGSHASSAPRVRHDRHGEQPN